jgi:hypothetical protein
VLIGLTGLARIDFGVIIAFFLFIRLLNDRKSLLPSIITGVTALFIISPWFYYVSQITGSFMPSSGGAQSSFISSPDMLFDRFAKMLFALSDNATPFIYGTGVFSVLALCTSLLLVVLIYKKRTLISIEPVYKYWLISSLLLLPIYVYAFWAAHFYSRYSAPLTLFFIPIISVLIYSLSISKKLNFLIYFGFCSFFFFSTIVFHRGAVQNNHSYSAQYIIENHQKDKVGAFQSGVIGYFNSNVINLDGKLDFESLALLKKGDIHLYIEEKEIDVIIDWKSYISMINSEYLKNNFTLKEALPNGSSVYIRKPIQNKTHSEYKI